jgi:exodeoxyribonuclease V gamma subunit
LLKDAGELVGGGHEPGSVEVNLRLPNGRSLVGTVPDVSGNLLRTVTYSRIGPKHRLTAWVRILALTAAYPDRHFESATVGRGRGRSLVTIAHVGAFEGDDDKRRQIALEHLETLVSLYDQGMSEPLPLYCATSAAYAEAVLAGRDPLTAARQAWVSPWNFDKEDKEPEHVLVLGGVQSLEQMLARAFDGDEEEGSARFGLFALRLWGGLLACEKLVQR